MYLFQMKKKIRMALSKTLFKEAPFVAVSANPENATPIGNACEFNATKACSLDLSALGLDELLSRMKSFTVAPTRDLTGSFLFAVDHCFGIRGQGTVLTGTILKGSVAIGDVSRFKTTIFEKTHQSFFADRRDRVNPRVP